jgi:hypothetical protein
MSGSDGDFGQRGHDHHCVKGNQVCWTPQPPDWNGNYITPGRKIAPGTIVPGARSQQHDRVPTSGSGARQPAPPQPGIIAREFLGRPWTPGRRSAREPP